MKAGNTCDVAIIGGGVIGLSCAWRLAQRGAKVHIFERGQVGKEASWAAAGMLAAQVEAAVHPPQNAEENPVAREAFFDLCLKSRALYPVLAEELLDATGVDIELSLREYSRSDWRTPGILLKQESGESWLADEGQVENRKLIVALRAACEKLGVEIQENCGVSPLPVGQNRLLCAGAWSSQVLETPEFFVPPIRPVAGEMLMARSNCELDKIIYSREVYLVPRRDGRVLIGATMHECGFDQTPTLAAREHLRNAAMQLFPAAQNWTIENHWAGLRPATPDGLPILGTTPLENLFVATGHFRNGILLAPITAELMADCILEGREPPREFSLERFESGVLAL